MQQICTRLRIKEYHILDENQNFIHAGNALDRATFFLHISTNCTKLHPILYRKCAGHGQIWCGGGGGSGGCNPPKWSDSWYIMQHYQPCRCIGLYSKELGGSSGHVLNSCRTTLQISCGEVLHFCQGLVQQLGLCRSRQLNGLWF